MINDLDHHHHVKFTIGYHIFDTAVWSRGSEFSFPSSQGVHELGWFKARFDLL